MRVRIVLALIAVLLAAIVCTGAAAAHDVPMPPVRDSTQVTIPLYSGIGTVQFPVTTSSPLAQKYFDQGMAFDYGFNHYQAERSFAQAARIDPQMAMAYWGTALVLGPNYNQPGDDERGARAIAAMRRAQTIERKVTARERDLIAALAQRYGDDGKETPTRNQAYANAMREAAHRYPDDAEVQTIFAESLMDLHPWQLWTANGKPGPDTLELVSTLEGVLKKNPNHLGANHYYIHAVEASADRARAIPSADRLTTLAPASGHLVHMPAHIYINTGRYEDAAKANENAIKVDEAFFAKTKEGDVYLVIYDLHNIHFLCYVRMMQGRLDDAMASARKLQAHLPIETIRAMPMAEYMAPVALEVEARSGNWDAILQEPEPPTDLSYTDAIWHYARGLAFAAKKRFDDAEHERERLEAITAAVPADRPLGSSNSEKRVCELAIVVLTAEIASAQGEHTVAAAKLGDAVRMQDALIYDEPPIWYFPVREELGTELLAAGQVDQAEAVYRADLKINPGNPRSLKGLRESLHAQK